MPQKVHGTTKEKMIIWAMIVLLFAIAGGGIGSCGLYLAFSGKRGITQTGRDIQEHVQQGVKQQVDHPESRSAPAGVNHARPVGEPASLSDFVILIHTF